MFGKKDGGNFNKDPVDNSVEGGNANGNGNIHVIEGQNHHNQNQNLNLATIQDATDELVSNSSPQLTGILGDGVAKNPFAPKELVQNLRAQTQSTSQGS